MMHEFRKKCGMRKLALIVTDTTDDSQHFVRIEDYAKHTETGDKLVIYYHREKCYLSPALSFLKEVGCEMDSTRDDLNDARIQPGMIVKHFKRETLMRPYKEYLYFVIGFATMAATGEAFVVYRALYGKNEYFARPFDMFMGEVDHEKYPDIKQKYRLEEYKGKE